MSGLNLFLNPQIRDYAKANDLSFSNEEVNQINASIDSIASLDDGGKVRFNLAQGTIGSLDVVIGAMSVGLGKPATTTPTMTPSLPAGANATERALAANAAIREGRTAARAVEAQNLLDEDGNPWDPRSISRTRQAVITNLDPALAARLRRQAGLRR